MAFAGFDLLSYPGDDTMQWIKSNTNISFVGFYLAPAPSRPNSDWMGNYRVLADQGWGFAPIYVGQQELGQPGSHNLTGEQGTIDGRSATDLMFQAGFPPNSIVYLDCEQGGPASNATLEYVGAWVDAVRLSVNTYAPGIYCSYTTVASLLAIRPDIPAWVWHITNPAQGAIFPTPDPAASGCLQATVWQYFQKTDVTFDGAPNPDLTVDLDSASTRDPSKAAIAQPFTSSGRRRKKSAAKKRKATKIKAKKAPSKRKASKAKTKKTANKKPKARKTKRSVRK
ncbi:glycoside hydrolase domain-containing protein [Bradyrhizobium oligotrophicum]|uniref:glycoside hydrolase domain-containing protein n=1 Tax=Bradyrhizobium oligotrophicum TaxID=44255 RepID=UPI003EB8308A